jgi:hypothetical protein
MRTYLFLLLVMFFGTSKTQGQDSKDYFIGFFAERTNILETQIGHAFIGIGKGIPLTCNLDGTETEMFGFYPSVHIEGGKSLWAGPVDGQIKNDARTQIDNYVFKKITFADYLRVKLKIEEWKNKKYEVTRNDCINFFQDVAKLFEEIKLPDRTKYVTPNTYVSQFIFINKLLQ